MKTKTMMLLCIVNAITPFMISEPTISYKTSEGLRMMHAEALGFFLSCNHSSSSVPIDGDIRRRDMVGAYLNFL